MRISIEREGSESCAVEFFLYSLIKTKRVKREALCVKENR
jgi:hypothetical protein